MFVPFVTTGAGSATTMDSTDRGRWPFLIDQTLKYRFKRKIMLFMVDRAMAKSGSTYLVH